MPRIKRKKLTTDAHGVIAATLMLSERLQLAVTAHSRYPNGVTVSMMAPDQSKSRSALWVWLEMTDEETRELFAVLGELLKLKRAGMKRTPKPRSSKPKRSLGRR